MSRRLKIPADMADMARRIRELRKKLDWSQKRLAEEVLVSQPTVHRWEKGEDQPDEANLRKLARLARISVAQFKYGQVNVAGGMSLVPIVGTVGPGEKVDLITGGSEATAERVPLPPGLEAEGIVALVIRGNAMRPLRDGWILYYRPSDSAPEDGLNELCVVQLADGRELVKEMRRGSQPGLYTLTSWNANVDPLEDQQVLRASLVQAIRRP